jgi:hypothetical protein
MGERLLYNNGIYYCGQGIKDVMSTIRTWTLSEDEGKSVETHFKKFQEYVQPKQNPVFSWYKFNNEIQGAQPVDSLRTVYTAMLKMTWYEIGLSLVLTQPRCERDP